MKAPYAVVRKHFPDVQSISPAELYQWIGYPENIDDPNFLNTCAIRMSLARRPAIPPGNLRRAVCRKPTTPPLYSRHMVEMVRLSPS